MESDPQKIRKLRKRLNELNLQAVALYEQMDALADDPVMYLSKLGTLQKVLAEATKICEELPPD